MTFDLSPWLWLLITTYLTTLILSVWLHRSITHRALTLHPLLSHPMRFWFWMATATNVRVWVVVHRWHHSRSDQAEDPHSPHNEGFWRMMANGLTPSCSRALQKNPQLLDQLSAGVPQDWIQTRLYDRFPQLGFGLLLIVNCVVCGIWGPWVWLGQMIWGVLAERLFAIVPHWVGYRNYDLDDHSHNWLPWGIVILGEEMHNNHHEDAGDPKFSRKWWELDPSWWFIQVAVWLRLAKLRERT
jgi:stearoyl-CoA desaturase (delta-9 desaturase)